MLSTTGCLAWLDHHSRFTLEPEPEDWSADAIRSELHRVLQSPQFDASERNRRFLRYVIEEALAGRAGRIKAYNIATEVFGRDVNFDPQLDPVVRMEARRLRRALERFYLIDGRASTVRIAMPKGRYVPEFLSGVLNLDATGAAKPVYRAESSASRRTASIEVMPFDAEGDQSSFLHFNQGFADQILVGLSKYPELSVYGADATRRQLPTSSGPAEERLKVDFELFGSTAFFGSLVNVKAVLTEVHTGRVVWGQTLEQDVRSDDLLGVRDEIANRIVRGLAEPNGAILGAVGKLAETRASETLTPLESIARFSKYRMSRSRNLYHQVRGALEHSVVVAPDYAETWACLSQVYSDGCRFGFASESSAATLVQQAVRVAEKAAELDPHSSRARHALGLALWLSGDAQDSLEALRAAMELNSNAVEVRNDLGLLWILLGRWDLGLPLLNEVLAQVPESPTTRVGLSLYHFANQRYDDALEHAQAVHTPDIPQGFAIRAASLIRLGRRAEAERETERIVRLAPYNSRGVLFALTGGSAHPELVEKLRSSLQEAGIPCEFLHF
jgi:adenylate cyclase